VDPDKCLEEILDLVRRIQDEPGYRDEALAERVLNLHEWIVKGGYLPKPWRERPRPK